MASPSMTETMTPISSGGAAGGRRSGRGWLDAYQVVRQRRRSREQQARLQELVDNLTWAEQEAVKQEEELRVLKEAWRIRTYT